MNSIIALHFDETLFDSLHENELRFFDKEEHFHYRKKLLARRGFFIYNNL